MDGSNADFSQPSGQSKPSKQSSEATNTPEMSIAIEVSKITLTKGGGAISGIGEKFAANPVTGTHSFSVPLALSPGRAGFGPQRALGYDSGTGTGPFGVKLNLALPTISRTKNKGLPRYVAAEQEDTWLTSGSEDLVPQLNECINQIKTTDRAGNGQSYTTFYYRPRIKGLFPRTEIDIVNSRTFEGNPNKTPSMDCLYTGVKKET